MECTEIDMALESAESLEDPNQAWAKRLRTFRWRRGGVGLLTLCLGAGFFWYLSRHGSGNPLTGLFERFALYLAGLCALFGIAIVITQAFHLLFGAPKAPRNPGDVVRGFYSRTFMNGSFGRQTVDPEAFAYLLTQAKKCFADITEFEVKFKDIRQDYIEELNRRFEPDKGSEVLYAIRDVKEVNSQGDLKTFEVAIEATLSTSKSTPPYTRFIGTVLIRERCTVAPVGGRWYLTSGNWTGQIDG